MWIPRHQPNVVIRGYAGSGTTNLSLHKMMQGLQQNPNAEHIHINDEWHAGHMFDALGRLRYTEELLVQHHSGNTGRITFIDYHVGDDRWKGLRMHLETCVDKKVFVYLDIPSVTRVQHGKISVVKPVGEAPHPHRLYRMPDTDFYDLIKGHAFECATVRQRDWPLR